MKSLFLSSILLPVAAVAQQDSSLHRAETFSVHGQTTVVSQFKPAFKAPYSGTNSLKTDKENGTSLTSTLYLCAKLWPHASIYVNPEIADGAGLSAVLGLGDGSHYGWEKRTEIYYSASLLRNHVYLSGAYQFIVNPGYNKDRNGPVNVFSLRVHTLI